MRRSIRYPTMKRFIRGTSLFVCIWVTCVLVFLLQTIGSTQKRPPFYRVIRNVTRASVRGLEGNKPTQSISKVSKNVSITRGIVNMDVDAFDNGINRRLTQTPRPVHQEKWNKWKQNADFHLDDYNNLKTNSHIRVVQKSVRIAENAPLNNSLKDLGKLPEQNDSLSVIFMRRKAAENRYYSLKKTKVNPIEYEFLITGAQICDAMAPFLLVIVPSTPTHFSVRNVIRKSYGSYAKIKTNVLKKTSKEALETMKILFLVGRGGNDSVDKSLKNESRTYGDIVQADFQESYYNLTLKMLLALKWTAFYCGEIDYLLKIDEDTFFNFPLLTNFLKKHPYDMKGTIYGHINHQSSVRRTGKWKVGWKEFPLMFYPTYASGNSYVISGNIVPRMFMASEYYPYMPIEDAFVTGVLARVIEANHLDVRGFTYWGESKPDPCAFVRESKMSATQVTEELMEKLWNSTTDFDTYCRYNLKTVNK